MYEIYADSVGNCDLYGFVEVSDLAFSQQDETASSVVIDPTEERLRD